MTIKYPAGPVTPRGRHHIRKGDLPSVSLQSANDEVVFWLMGGESMPWSTMPESVQIKSLKGLIPPWQTIDQQGANEDGTTFIDALYEPIEVELKALVTGRDHKHTRRVARHLLESIDVKKPAELGWRTHELGYWWAPVRWFKTAPNKYSGSPTEQEWDLVLRADSGFWQSYPDLASFSFKYEDFVDEFDTNYPDDLGPDWPQYYDGDGGGYQYSSGGLARWRDDPNDTFTTKSRTVVNGPYRDFETATDHQVGTIVLGAMPEWSLPSSGANDIWVRMGRNEDGSWNGDGIRARITLGAVTLAAYVNFEQVWERVKRPGLFEAPIIPFVGGRWDLVAGYPDEPRMFKILRNGSPLLTYKETGTASKLGSSWRGVGFGCRAAGALLTQATPATVRRISAGDNGEVTQMGFLERHNAGDQDAYDEYTLYGPAKKFLIANGPGSTEFVEFGPLGVGEIAHIRTDPRNRQVFDLTERTGAESSPALFGANPSDTMYRKLNGRFTSDCAIPAKEAGMRVKTYTVACGIQGGNADSRIDAQLTPLRRYPQ